MTQLEAARQGIITKEMKQCAEQENVAPSLSESGVVNGTIVVVRNNIHVGIPAMAVGKGLKTKINANVGTSRDRIDLAMELEKVKVSISAGADTIMDLSTGGDLRAIRKEIMSQSTVAVGTVPIYQAASRMIEEKRAIIEMSAEDIFQAIEENGEDGVDFITVHCGVTRKCRPNRKRGAATWYCQQRRVHNGKLDGLQ